MTPRGAASGQTNDHNPQTLHTPIIYPNHALHRLGRPLQASVRHCQQTAPTICINFMYSVIVAQRSAVGPSLLLA